jgi:predicted ribosome quality control (RQC) complex YloA/Tae2 family protein
VLIGRNSRENDELTFRVAADHDFWFHVADYSGSHVIVRNPSGRGELEQPLLIRAAQLAAYYSQARNSSKVAVHYTQRKYVTKPRKARPGLVQLRQFHTVTVEPRDQTREELAPVDGQGSRVSGEGKA